MHSAPSELIVMAPTPVRNVLGNVVSVNLRTIVPVVSARTSITSTNVLMIALLAIMNKTTSASNVNKTVLNACRIGNVFSALIHFPL